MIQIGNDKIKDIYFGSDKIKEVYYGSEKVWGEIASIQDGYWVHKDTNAVTYFGADADFITGGIMSSPPWNLDCSEVQFPTGVTSLGTGCFDRCKSLTSFTLSESVTSLEQNCFRYCDGLTSINIPEGVTSLGTGCFSVCLGITSVNIPESVTSIGVFCFSGCTALTLVTVLPATPPTLGFGAFDSVHTSFNIKVRSPYVNAYKTATNWKSYASKISAI